MTSVVTSQNVRSQVLPCHGVLLQDLFLCEKSSGFPGPSGTCHSRRTDRKMPRLPRLPQGNRFPGKPRISTLSIWSPKKIPTSFQLGSLVDALFFLRHFRKRKLRSVSFVITWLQVSWSRGSGELGPKLFGAQRITLCHPTTGVRSRELTLLAPRNKGRRCVAHKSNLNLPFLRLHT